MQGGIIALQGRYGFLAGADVFSVAQRVVQPLGEQAAAHVAGAAVEGGKEGGLFFAGQGGGDFKVVAGGGIHADILLFGFEAEVVEVARQAGLGVADVVEQGAGGADGRIVFAGLEAEAEQVLAAEVVGEQGVGAVGGELPVVQAGGVAVFR